MPNVDVDKLAWCPMVAWLGRRTVPVRSKPNCCCVLVLSCSGFLALKRDFTAELRRVSPSVKWPDRFSRREAWRPNPESLLDTGVLEKVDEIGDGAAGDGGEWLDD